MKNIFGILAVIFVSISCNKNKDDVKAPERKTLLSKLISVSGTGSERFSEYTYDDAGRITRLVSNMAFDPALTSIYTHDSRGNIATVRFVERGKNGSDYTYDNQDRLISKQGYYDDGSRGPRSDYTYFEDRVEELLYDNTNTLTNKYQYFYTADKRNIASEKRFLASGVLTSDLTFTYNMAVKALPTGLSGTLVNKSENVLAKTIAIQHYNNGKTITQTYNYVGNADGYPASMEYITSEYPNSSTTTTYEYIVKEIKE